MHDFFLGELGVVFAEFVGTGFLLIDLDLSFERLFGHREKKGALKIENLWSLYGIVIVKTAVLLDRLLPVCRTLSVCA